MEKTFDCLKMKEEIQAKIYDEIKDMSSSEILSYFNKKSQNSILWQRLVQRDNALKNNMNQVNTAPNNQLSVAFSACCKHAMKTRLNETGQRWERRGEIPPRDLIICHLLTTVAHNTATVVKK